MAAQTRGAALVVVSAVAFGFMPLFALSAYGGGVTVDTVLFWRFGLSAVLLALVAWRLGQLRRPTWRQGLTILTLGGVLYAAQASCFFTAVSRIPPALAVLLLYLYPAIVATGSCLLERTRPSVGVVVALLASFAGVALAVGPLDGSRDIIGLVCGVGAALFYTVYILISDRVGDRVPPLLTSVGVCASATVTFGVYGVISGGLRPLAALQAWPAVLALAVIGGAIAISTFLIGVGLVGPTWASVLSMLEPVVGVLVAATLLNAAMSAAQWVGVVLVVAGALVAVLSQRRDAVDVVSDVPV